MEFTAFPKIARLNRDIVITEKIDGTNAQVFVEPVVERGYLARMGITHMVERGEWFFGAGSRTRFITPDDDNFGFARWAYDHAEELIDGLGAGRHYGEWWGSGIQRGYGLQKGEKRFSLFNVARWSDDRDREKFPTDRPDCCGVVPTLYRGAFDPSAIQDALEWLRVYGSSAAPGFMRPEGVVVFHTASGTMYKVTLEKDEEPKGRAK